MIGVIGALGQEINLIKNNIQNSHTQQILGNIFYYGQIFNKDIVVSECSIGKINAAITATTMMNNYNPDVIINTGIAGSMNDKVNIMDVVIANKISIHDEGEVFNRYYPFATSFKVDNIIVDLAKRSYLKKGYCCNQLHIGEVITGDIYIKNDVIKQNVKSQYLNSLAVDMESGAIAKVCFRNNKNLIVIKTISDEANDNANFNYDRFIYEAARKSSDIVLEIMRNW